MMSPQGGLSIATVDGNARRKDWLRVPHEVYADDPAWVPQLLFQEKQRISPRHSPFFSFGDAAFFIAYRDLRPVGRISAQINRRYQQHYHSAAGHFGFFDCLEDAEAAGALVDAAANWLKSRGADRMEGPYSLSANEESGLLVEGFDTPAALLMNHARPYMGGLLERAGLAKVVDTLAYRMSPQSVGVEIGQLAEYARASSRLEIRKIDTSRFDDEIRVIMDIFNDAWSDNWGFVPFSEAEITALIKELKPFYRADYGRIVNVDGEPAALMLAMPDINSLIADFGGRLVPFNWLTLAFRLWRQTFRSIRIPLMGIRKKHRNPLTAVGILALLVSDFLEEMKNYNVDWIEFSWILETNRPMKSLAMKAAGAPTKRYRIYGKSLQ